MKTHKYFIKNLVCAISCGFAVSISPAANAHASDVYQAVPYVKFKSAEWTKDATL